MSVYNERRFLDGAAESILVQSFSDFEFIIVNDGSTDGSSEVLESYGLLDERISIINQDNYGLITSLNRAVEASSGMYIARMDADDISKPNRLQKQVSLLKDKPEVGICGGWIRKFGSKRSARNEFCI
jgi:glycosyltransferase involved in cell wall biosynthesis